MTEPSAAFAVEDLAMGSAPAMRQNFIRRNAFSSGSSSLSERRRPVIAFGGPGQASADVGRFQLGKIAQQFRLSDAVRQLTQHVVDRDPKTADRRLPTTLSRLKGDPIHAGKPIRGGGALQRPGTAGRRSRLACEFQTIV